MKIAIVHDLLAEFGGAERFLQALLAIFPEADVYTSFIESEVISMHFPQLPKKQLHITWVQGTPLMSRSSLFQCFSPFVWRSLNLEKYDVVISSSSHLLSCLVPVHRPKLILYIHNPPKNIFSLLPKTRLQQIVPYTGIIRRLFISAVKNAPVVITNSNHMSKIIKEETGITSRVIYPPVKIPKNIVKKNKNSFFLCVSRIDSTKSLEIAVKACTDLNLPLKIVGKTNEESYLKYLKRIAGSTVTFTGPLSDNAIHKLYQSATALIFPSKNEDFGLVPVEAMSFGVPIIAYYGGGTIETVIEGITGTFFHQHTASSLKDKLESFHPEIYHQHILVQHAEKFSSKIFEKKILSLVNGD